MRAETVPGAEPGSPASPSTEARGAGQPKPEAAKGSAGAKSGSKDGPGSPAVKPSSKPQPAAEPAAESVRQVAAKGLSSRAAVVDGVKLIALDEVRWWERHMLREVDEDQWKSFAYEDGKYSFYKADAGALQQDGAGNKDLKVFLGQLFIPNKSPVEVFHQLYDVPTREKWDNCYMINEISHTFPDQPFHNELWFTRVRIPVMKARDFLLLRGYVLYLDAQGLIGSHMAGHDSAPPSLEAAVVDPDRDYKEYLAEGRKQELQAITYMYRSAEHASQPEDKETLRAFSQGANLFYSTPQPKTMKLNGVEMPLPEDRVSKGRQGTLMYLVSSNDPKASVPAWMINSAAVSSFKDWCKLVLKHMDTI
jgi:hypothetical protein